MEQYSLKTLRASRNWTQKETAEKLNVSTTTYSLWEKDLSNVGISKVQLIADLFGINISEISY